MSRIETRLSARTAVALLVIGNRRRLGDRPDGGYMLWMMQRMYLGAITEKYAGIAEISGRELFTLVPLGIIVIVIGVYPQPILELLSNTLSQINGIILPYR